MKNSVYCLQEKRVNSLPENRKC